MGTNTINKEKPAISFVIPAHNEEGYLSECLESVMAQTQNISKKIEIIVVNNASTDKTKEIAEGFAEVTVIDEPRKGTGFARQAGFLQASAELIANIDADTILPPNWLKTALDFLEKNPKVVALSGPALYYDLPVTKKFFVHLYYGGTYTIYFINRFLLRVGSVLLGGNMVIRRDALQKIGGYDTKILFYGDDTDLARKLSKIGGVKFTFDFPIYTSARRLISQGLTYSAAYYSLNYFSTLFLKRPFSKKYVDVREDR
jgi:glycosyltransferase involved in cell wall biosynthesis